MINILLQQTTLELHNGKQLFSNFSVTPNVVTNSGKLNRSKTST